ncbi:MAG TPA: putative Ig domain-containing protein, partial [Vicinamibacterales bacterium]|nr:putative Ig domain-containing protein [Vicinamibacterales bacterium]
MVGLLVAVLPVAAERGAAVSQTHNPNFGTFSVGQVEAPLTATGGDGVNYAWSLNGGTLPPGLAIRTDLPNCCFPGTARAGLIGVATTPGTYNFTLRVTSGIDTADVPSTMKITALTVKDLNSLPDAFVNEPYSYTLTAIGNAGALTWTPTGAMPAGMSLSAAGVLSGTPTTAASNFFIPYSLTDGTDTVFKNTTLTMSAINVSPVGAIAPGVLPNATQTGPYSGSVSASGGAGGYTYTQFGLPSGLNLNSSTGAITGTVNPGSFNIGKFSVSVTAKDSLNVSYQKTLSLTVVGAVAVLPAVQPSQSSFDGCTIGIPCSRTVIVQNGGVAPFTWVANGLPAGMTMRYGSGVTSRSTTPGDAELWGTPTVTGLFNVEVTVTDATGATASNTFPLRVSTLVQTNFLSLGGNGLINTPYSRTMRVIGGTLPYTVAQTSGLLPAGLTLNTSTLVVSGTPTESGGFSTQFTFTDAGGPAQTLPAFNFYNITSAGSGAVSINSSSNLGSTTTGFSYSTTLNGSGGSGLTWTTSGVLPTGVTLSSGGTLSGTPTVSGVYSFLVRAADNGNASNSAERQFTLNVTPMSISTSSS